MANTPQAKKRIRRNARRAEVNGARVSRIRTFRQQVETAIASGDKEQATAAISPGPAGDRQRRIQGRAPQEYGGPQISRLSRRVAALTEPFRLSRGKGPAGFRRAFSWHERRCPALPKP